MNTETIYQIGERAYRNGCALNQCPFPAASLESIEWQCGYYNHMRRDMLKKLRLRIAVASLSFLALSTFIITYWLLPLNRM